MWLLLGAVSVGVAHGKVRVEDLNQLRGHCVGMEKSWNSNCCGDRKQGQVGILGGSKTIKNREGSLCDSGGVRRALGTWRKFAQKFVAVTCLQHMATIFQILWKISAVVLSHNTTDCNRAMALSVFAAVSELLSHELPFHVFCWHERQRTG